MIRVEVLVSTMNQVDTSIYNKMRIQTAAVIANQADEYDYFERTINGKTIKMITTPLRGLSRNRNLALFYASGDICIIADDDVVYLDGYEEGIIRAYEEIPEADVIFFNVKSKAKEREIRSIGKAIRIRGHQSYPSVCTTFKRESILRNDLWFPYLLGCGSVYEFGEDGNFIRNAKKKKMKIYAHPFKMAEVSQESSLWFTGCNRKYFFDVGAYLAATYPVQKWILMHYYFFKLRNRTELSPKDTYKLIVSGMSAYKKGISYDKWGKAKMKKRNQY